MTPSQSDRFRVTRIQLNIVAQRERQLLTWLCGQLPSSVTPDRLTVFSILGAFLVLLASCVSRYNPAFLWLASLGFVINWFGDSLDGSLARYRGIERPVYGYFLDHSVDALNNLVMMIGVGATIAVRMDVALFALAGYYMLCMYVFINNHLSGVFHLSFLGFGPTELRICLIGINTAMFFFGRFGTTIDGQFFSIYDGLILFTGSMFVGVFVHRVIRGLRELRQLGHNLPRSGARQSVATNPSSFSK